MLFFLKKKTFKTGAFALFPASLPFPIVFELAYTDIPLPATLTLLNGGREQTS